MRPFAQNLLGRDPQGADHPVRQGPPSRVIIRKDRPGPDQDDRGRRHNSTGLAQRSTTPLFGMGLIDSIPQSVIEEIVAMRPKRIPMYTAASSAVSAGVGNC